MFTAAHANEKGNGGDICENRFKIVRDDLKTWILGGGSLGLQLPTGLAVDHYNMEMLKEIDQAKITCTDDRQFIGNSEKTCKNFDAADGSTYVICNIDRFSKTDESDQYVLVHHEYAGLAGFEVNNGEESVYPISNQITGYLEDQIIKKLVVKPPHNSEDPFDPASCTGNPISNDEMKTFFKPGEMSVKVGDVNLYIRTRKCNHVTGCTDWYGPSSSEVTFGHKGCNSGYSSCGWGESELKRTGELSFVVNAGSIDTNLSMHDYYRDYLKTTPVIPALNGSVATKAEYGFKSYPGQFWYYNVTFVRHKEQIYNKGPAVNLSGLITRSCMRLQTLVTDEIKDKGYYYEHELVAFSQY